MDTSSNAFAKLNGFAELSRSMPWAAGLLYPIHSGAAGAHRGDRGARGAPVRAPRRAVAGSARGDRAARGRLGRRVRGSRAPRRGARVRHGRPLGDMPWRWTATAAKEFADACICLRRHTCQLRRERPNGFDPSPPGSLLWSVLAVVFPFCRWALTSALRCRRCAPPAPPWSPQAPQPSPFQHY